MNNDYSIKFIILGDVNVGKSSFLKYYINKKNEDVCTTIGVDYYVKYINIDDKLLKIFNLGYSWPRKI